ncbi:hypothetical protein JW859_00015 [bacterium]|nr:hypothetical protein [bacterium]
MRLLSQLINQLSMPAQVWDARGNVLVTNPRFNELFGLPVMFDWARHKLSIVHDIQIKNAGIDALFNRALNGMPTEIHSLTYDPSRLPYRDGNSTDSLMLFMNLWPLLDDHNDVECVVCLISDSASSGARFEHELMRSQKMENIERLASGVAHEFNNIFTGIKGMTELIKDEVEEDSEIYEFADSIQQNISRGAELIQQLSSFAREVPITLRRKSLSAYLERALPLMQMHVQRRVKISTDIRRDAEVLIDASRLDQALANIMLNARDAMGNQGQIKVTVDRTQPEPEPGQDLPAGIDWCVIEIADSGPGIPPELRQRALEPFFTTKERGKATGLGLSVTSRIILSHNGLIQIGEAEELGGAAIRIFLPVAEARTDAAG